MSRLILALTLLCPVATLAQPMVQQEPARSLMDMVLGQLSVDEIIEDGARIVVRGSLAQPGRGPRHQQEFECERNGRALLVRDHQMATIDLYPINEDFCEALLAALRRR
jgi:hypothetical protein